MKRRDFIAFSSIGVCAFTVSLGTLNPPKADAFILFLLRSLASRSLMNMVFRGVVRGAFGSSSNTAQRQQEWFDARLEAQLAQREFIRRSFTDISVAESTRPGYTYIVGAFREEPLGNSVGLAFPRMNDGRATMSAFSGPGPIGMAIAAEYLSQQENLSPSDVQAAILPRPRGGVELTDWRTWSSGGSIIYPNTFSDTGTRIHYDAVEPRLGGFGTIDVTINAHRQVRLPQIRVEFS